MILYADLIAEAAHRWDIATDSSGHLRLLQFLETVNVGSNISALNEQAAPDIRRQRCMRANWQTIDPSARYLGRWLDGCKVNVVIDEI